MTNAAAAENGGVHVSCTGAPFEIHVKVGNALTNAGLMVAELYPNRAEDFLTGSGRLEIVRYAAKAPETNFCLKAPGPGEYAVSVYQDENANTNFDKNFLGLPAEPWGLSNNPRVGMHGPKFEETLFHVDENGADVVISLRR